MASACRRPARGKMWPAAAQPELPNALLHALAVLFVLARAAAAAATEDVERCVNDTFGMAGEHFSRPYEPGLERLTCEYKHTDAGNVPSLVLAYYPSIQNFADYNGTDMVPNGGADLGEKLKWRLDPWVVGQNGPVHQSRKVQMASCDIPRPDGGGYTIQKIGPLVSTGNYDYWQIAWSDIGGLSRFLAERPEGIMFTSSFSGPIDPYGKILGHPPIHIHHIHITRPPGVVTAMNPSDCITALDPSQCYSPNLVIEQHGDYQCTQVDGGVDCFFEETADGYAKILKTPLDLEGEINDVRAPNSEPMVWYYQIVIRWLPLTSRFKPLSQRFMVGPGMLNEADQRHNVLVFPVNTAASSLYWYSGYMGQEGVMTRNKLHAHNTMFHYAFFFHATPHQLGLDDPKFWPSASWLPLLLPEVGFHDFETLEAFFLGNLAGAARRWDVACPPTRPGCAAQRPKIICESWVSNEDFLDPVSGKIFAYDRRAPCCCKPWHFRADDIFTVVSFMAPMRTPPGPWMPDAIPPKANMHVHWLLTYDTLDNRSHYKCTIYTQNKDISVNFPDEGDLSRFPLFQHIEAELFGHWGFTNKRMSLPRRAIVAIFWLVHMGASQPFWCYGWAVFACIACLLFNLHLLAWCRWAKRSVDHPAVQCAKAVPCTTAPAVVLVEDCVRYAGAVEHDE